MPAPAVLAKRTFDDQFETWERERDLLLFTQDGLPYVEPNAFQLNWHIEAITDHLKSLGTNVFFPAWAWAQDPDPLRQKHGFGVQPGTLKGPGVKFMFMSYDQTLTTRDSVRCRQLIESKWYQDRWSERSKLRHDQNTKTRFDNLHGGHRFSTSFGGLATGEGADIIVCDDPHNTKSIACE
jgi:hypothetical protein